MLDWLKSMEMAIGAIVWGVALGVFKQKRKISIRDHKERNKFCIKQNKYFGCKDAHMCNISCPLWHWYEVVLQMDMKNLPLGEAFRLSYRQSITAEERRKIFKDRIGNKKSYPAKS